jgi:F-type H+-transporting ATPase subunit delta
MSPRAVAARYARALLDVTVASGDPDRVERDLADLAALLREAPALATLLAHPGLPLARKRALLEALFGRLGEPDPTVRRLLTMLVERGRTRLLPEVHEAYRTRLMEHRRMVQARVTTAAPLAPALVDRLASRLSAVTGRQVQLVVEVDPTLMGGVVARIGSLVYDGSLTRQLERLKERLQQAV